MSLLQLRTRFKSVKGLNSIFEALEVVTVVRTKKVKAPFQLLERYLAPMREVLNGRLEEKKLSDKVLVVVTSNRGLCGGFNNQVVGKAREFLAQNPGTKLVMLGRFGEQRFRKQAVPIAFADHEITEKTDPARVAELLKRLVGLKAEVHVAYNTYKSSMVQLPVVSRLYPVPAELVSKKQPAEFLLEPGPEELVDNLFAHYLTTRLFQILLDSQMGELSARLMVLNGAIDTSKEITDKLAIQINKARQASITKDLLEIVSTAEALRSQDE